MLRSSHSKTSASPTSGLRVSSNKPPAPTTQTAPLMTPPCSKEKPGVPTRSATILMFVPTMPSIPPNGLMNLKPCFNASKITSYAPSSTSCLTTLPDPTAAMSAPISALEITTTPRSFSNLTTIFTISENFTPGEGHHSNSPHPTVEKPSTSQKVNLAASQEITQLLGLHRSMIGMKPSSSTTVTTSR